MTQATRDCTKTKPNPRASAHDNVVDYTRITVRGGLVQNTPMLRCLNCGLEVAESAGRESGTRRDDQ